MAAGSARALREAVWASGDRMSSRQHTARLWQTHPILTPSVLSFFFPQAQLSKNTRQGEEHTYQHAQLHAQLFSGQPQTGGQ